MNRIIGLIAGAIGALALSACAADANKSYEASITEVHDKLADLDMTKNIGSVAFKAPKDVTMDTGAADSVTWHVNTKSGAKLFDVVAHLTAQGDKQTRVAIEIVKGEAPDPLPEALNGVRANMMMERIAAHLEDRPFNDKPYLDAQYSMASPLIPKEMIENAKQSQMAIARIEGDIAEMSEKAKEEAALRANRGNLPERAGAPAVDLSKYRH